MRISDWSSDVCSSDLKSADEQPADDAADDDRDKDHAHHDDEFLTVEPEDLDRPMQELWQTFVHALLPCFTTPLDVGCGRRPPPPVPVAGRRSVRRPARLSDQHAEGDRKSTRLNSSH